MNCNGQDEPKTNPTRAAVNARIIEYRTVTP